MKPEEFTKSFDFVLDALLRWVACLRGPAAVSRSILSLAADPGDAFKRALSIWITALLLSVIARGWAYQLHGIGLGNVAFQLTSTLLLLGVLVGFVLCLQLGFRLFKLRIPFAETFVAYTVHVSALAPFIALIFSPLVARMIGLLKALKAEGVGLEEICPRYFAASSAQQDSTLGIVVMALQVISMPVFSVHFALVFGFLADRNQLQRTAVFNAGAFGFVLGLIPTGLLSLANLLVIYAFV